MSRRALTVIVAVTMATLATSCSSDDDDDAATGSDPSTSSATSVSDADPLDWKECGGLESAKLEVPRDYADPDGETLELALARREADGDRIGSLLVNPGGPGAPGIGLVENAEAYLSQDVLDRFDVVGWDPRGVGQSTPVDCVDDLDFFFGADHSPDDQAEVDEHIAVARQLADACAAESGDLLPFLSSNATVDDMDSIRVALGDEPLNYLGFSYGTYIGALYADRYPDEIRAMVLDGAVDPSLSFDALAAMQSEGFDRALGAFLDDCAENSCGFGGSDPHASYDSLMAQIDAEPLFADVDGEERELGPGEADIGVTSALYAGEAGWDELADALNDAAQGDGSGLLRLSDFYTERSPGGEYSNSQEAFFAIGCLDAPAPTVEELPAFAETIGSIAPEFGESSVWLSSPCSVWPVPSYPTLGPVSATGAPPIVVLGTTNDPATPYVWAESLASQLDSGVLVGFEGEGHTAYARGDECIDSVVDGYLIDLETPADGTRC